ncbi:MAG TPA: hypothetical protein VF552_05970 [Allosphingosinicella sp.]
MQRLLTLLIVIALTFGNGSAVAAALCEHGSTAAHQVALDSGDEGVAADAQSEDAAAAAASKKAAPGENNAAVAGYILPADPAAPMPLPRAGTNLAPERGSPLAGLSVPPLLEPPLA